MRRLYMSDLDGTIINKAPVSDYTRVTLNALIKRGLPFTLNTSRTPKTVMPVIDGLDLKLPVILMNGSCVFDTERREILELNPLKKAAARATVSAAWAIGIQPFVFECDGNDVAVEYIPASSPANDRFISERKNYYKSFDAVTRFDFNCVPYIVNVGSYETLKRLKTRLMFIPDISFSFFKSENEDYCFLEVYSKGAGKKNSAERFMKKYNFDALTSFGDNLNDVEMLEFSDRGLAVSDGHAEAKAAADEIIGPQSDDAVAKYLLLEWSRDPKMY